MHRYSPQDLAAVYRVIAERRDMRHFCPGPIDPPVFKRLLDAAHRAPSVGLMQPWRFIRITDGGLREQIRGLVEEERQRTAEALGKRQDEFLRLKVEGILQCGELLVAALADGREAHIFGRRTLPEMDLASVACAIQNFWLAARAEGLGMGWVSMFDPVALAALLGMPGGSQAGGRPLPRARRGVLSRPDAGAPGLDTRPPAGRIGIPQSLGKHRGRVMNGNAVQGPQGIAASPRRDRRR
jgi:5,6-dimethylbenzimidazole synthase